MDVQRSTPVRRRRIGLIILGIATLVAIAVVISLLIWVTSDGYPGAIG